MRVKQGKEEIGREGSQEGGVQEGEGTGVRGTEGRGSGKEGSRHGTAGQGRAGQGRAGQGRAGQGRAGQSTLLSLSPPLHTPNPTNPALPSHPHEENTLYCAETRLRLIQLCSLDLPPVIPRGNPHAWCSNVSPSAEP